MRPLILVAAAALTLSGCGTNDQADNTQNAQESLTADNIVSNDVTAIDAVTGDAANMAADVDYSNLVDNSLDNMLNESGSTKVGGKAPHTRPRASEPNTAANTTTNAE